MDSHGVAAGVGALVAVALGVLLGAGWPGAPAAARAAGDHVPAADAGQPVVTPEPPPVRRPVAVAPVAGEVLRAFRAPEHAYGPGHRGVDLAARPGEPVRAALAGTVRFAGDVAGQTWITVSHEGGLETTYGGLVAEVTAGDTVRMGARIGRVAGGRRWLDWGARRDGGYIDPLGLLSGWRVRLVPVER